MLDTICFDADDTLWESQAYFDAAELEIASLLADWATPETVDELLLQTARRNLPLYGFGVKSFVLTSLETIDEVTNGAAPPELARRVREIGKELLAHPVDLLPDVTDVVEQLAESHRTLIVTKGDNAHQRRKIAASGLEHVVDGYEILVDKTASSYREFLHRRDLVARSTLMIGNSLASDVLPPLDLGMHAVHLPHTSIWAHEDMASDDPRIRTIASITELPDHVRSVTDQPPSSD